MNLHIRRVVDGGDIQKERISLYAEAALDIGKFLIFQSKYVDESSVSGEINYPFWLPDLQVDAGDLVVIYTKKGAARSRPNSDGSKTHFIYRNLDAPIWTDREECAVLVEMTEWAFKKIN